MSNSGMPNSGGYGADTPLVDFIYGITYEIWEEKGVELIRQYYGQDMKMFALSGISQGAESIVQGTYDTLDSFPDRLLLTENVVWSDDGDGKYSSHRILSPMTNLGPTIYGPATNKHVYVRTVADCFVQDGVITREWLMRDTLPLVVQLGYDPIAAAKIVASKYQPQTRAWFAEELARIGQGQDVDHEWSGFAREVLSSLWVTGDEAALMRLYPHYTVLHPDPLRIVSGLPALQSYAADLRRCFAEVELCIDHVAIQPWSHHGYELAVRWTLRAKHAGEYQGLAATQKDVFILGSSHWRVVNNQVLTDWTVFDGLGVLAQLV